MEEILLIRTFVGELLLDSFAVLLVKLLALFFGDSEVALLAVVVIELFRRVEEFPLMGARRSLRVSLRMYLHLELAVIVSVNVNVYAH